LSSPNSAGKPHRYRADALERWAARVLMSAKVPPPDAAVTAQILIRSDLRGFSTHGLARLASYVDRLQSGDFDAAGKIEFDRSGHVWNVNANGALGQVAGQRVIEEAALSLPREPMLWVSLRESGHLGALGILALAAAERGYICFMGQRVPPLLGLPGFRERALGHNPFAFSAPAGKDASPLVIDMACSVAARGHILLAAREGKSIPPDWALAQDGQPTTDAKRAADGMLQPMGGYKGMAIAMMIECLAAALAGNAPSNLSPAMTLPANGAVPRQSAFFLFLNPALIDDQTAFLNYMQHWIGFYRQAGGEHARIPGARGAQLERMRRVEGIAYSPAIAAELTELGKRAGVPFAEAGGST
jgi:LDH2 family malate/lactate/ureidoglycolate dehydrogenase